MDAKFRADPGRASLPLLPDADGNMVEKSEVVYFLEVIAVDLGLPLFSTLGSLLYGCHWLRVSGAQWLARSRVSLT